MTAALPLVTLLLLADANPWLLRFEGFTATKEMKAEALDKMFRGVFEGLSDEKGSGFQVLDDGHVDVSIAITQSMDDEGIAFHWYLSMSECPGSTLDYVVHRPRKTVTLDATRELVREVVKKADQLRRGKIGKPSPSCQEEGDAYAGMKSTDADPTEPAKAPPQKKPAKKK